LERPVKTAYLDACAVIYLLEATSSLQALVRSRISELRDEGLETLMTSSLSRLECRVKPLRDGDAALLNLYDRFFASANLRTAAVSDAVIERATELRARHGFKTPDSIHLATAIEGGAQLFVTGDADLARCTEIAVEVVAE